MKKGRPPKVSLEIKKSVVDMFYIEIAGLETSMLRKKGIFTRLAEYARQTGIELVDTDFSKDKAIRSYIEEKNLEREQNAATEGAFVPLDVNAIVNKNRMQLQQYLLDRDRYYEDLYIRVKYALNTCKKNKTIIDELHNSLAEETSKKTLLSEELENIKRQLREKTQECSELKKYIREIVEPCLLEQFEKQTANRGAMLRFAQRSAETVIEPEETAATKILDLFKV